jgi:stage V sporulation protein K
MDEKNISKKDQIILQQLEVIRTMTEHNLRRMDTDFWGGAPISPAAPSAPGSSAPISPAAPSGGSAGSGGIAASTGNDTGSAPKVPGKTPGEDRGPGGGAGRLHRSHGGKKRGQNLINMVTVYKLRHEHDLPTTDLSLHMVFSGNPGTGKTTVARLMARIYHSLGILSKGQLVEVDRSGLVAGYVGQTALKTSKVLDAALGGVLFIDEAYALNGRAENDFGQEAIDTVLKAMEDHRDDLVVIAAGYDGLMDDFIHSNPGLESRFNRFLHFDDYTPDEMLQIFASQCKKGCYTLEDGAQEAVRGLSGDRQRRLHLLRQCPGRAQPL